MLLTALSCNLINSTITIMICILKIRLNAYYVKIFTENSLDVSSVRGII
jgi:hypothetical protein